MDYKRMLYFCTIVEQGQISRAAKVLNMSQPPLSQRLKELEDEVGTPLILRGAKQWQVTEAGQALYRKAQVILSQIDALSGEVSSAITPHKGQVRIGACASCLSYFLDILPELSKQYPDISYRLLVADNPSLEFQLQQRWVDFALLLLPLESDNCVARMLPEHNYVAVYPPSIAPPAGAGPISLEDLVAHPILLPRRWKSGGGYEPLMYALQQMNLQPRILLDTPSTNLVLDLLQRGVEAIAVMPDREVPHWYAGKFHIRPFVVPHLHFHPALVHLQDAYITAAMKTVVNTILQAAHTETIAKDGTYSITEV